MGALIAALAVLAVPPDAGVPCAALPQGERPIEDLEPEPGVLSGLMTRELRQAGDKLLAGAPDPLCRMLVLEDLLYGDKRWAVYLDRAKEPPTVVLREFSVKVVSPRKAVDTPISTRTAPIDTQAADVLQQVWLVMLERVRAAPRGAVRYFHPTAYYFGNRFSGGMYAWGHPACNDRPRRLIEIGRGLKAFVEAPPEARPALRGALLDPANALLDELVRLGHTRPDVAKERAEQERLRRVFGQEPRPRPRQPRPTP